MIRNIISDQCELIIIDDGSTDRTGIIADEYQKLYSYISVIHKQNGGLAAARNTAIKLAKSAYLCFIDADDFLYEGLSQLVLPKLDGKYDIVFFDSLNDDNDGSFVEIDEVKLSYFQNSSIYPSHQFREGEIFENVHITTAWAKFYKREFLINNALWNNEDVILAQDIIHNLRVYSKHPRMAAFNKRFYHHRVLFDSGCHRFRPQYFDISHSFIKAMYSIINTDYNNSIGMYDLSYARIINLLYNNLNLNICNAKNKASYSERKQQFNKLLNNEYYSEAIKNCDSSLLLPLHERLLVLIKAEKFISIDRMVRRKSRKSMLIAFLNEKNPILLNCIVKIKRNLR